MPGLAIKLSSPYWFDRVGYAARLLLGDAAVATSIVLVAYAQPPWLRLVGVGLGSAQCGLGEASALAYSQLFRNPKECLVAWSSGTGFAGPAGYVIPLFIMSHLPRAGDAAVSLLIIALNLASFAALRPSHVRGGGGAEAAPDDAPAILLLPPWEDVATVAVGSVGSANTVDTPVARAPTPPQAPAAAPLSGLERLALVLTLRRYAAPLFVVYWSEYVVQAGAWTAFALQPAASAATHARARERAYQRLNLMYQCGVFVSRSSGLLLRPSALRMNLAPCLQLAMLALFVSDGYAHFWTGQSLLAPAFVVGLFGGACYVLTATLINIEVPRQHRELALAATSAASDLGTMFANITSLFVQWCLFAANGVADVSYGRCPLGDAGI